MNQDPRLDNALLAIRAEEPDASTMEQAAARVRASLHIRTCADYQAMAASYKDGSLDEAQRLLFKDHIRECVACRRSLNGARKPAVVQMKPRAAWTRWAMAAGFTMAAGLAGWTAWNQFAGAGRDALRVEASSGRIYRVADGKLAELKPGDSIDGGTEIRTAKDANAMLRLGDGSRIEMRERSAFAVARSGRDITLQLAGGAVMVEAAKDRSRHLYVATRDARVAVTGTVFSVAAGVKGSRVSVVEGEVRVTQAGREQVLHAGDQSASAAVGRIKVEDDIAWSRNKAQHVAMLREFNALAKSLEGVLTPKARYRSTLIDRLPANTAVFASLPNLADALGQAERIIQERLAASPVLAEWWQRENQGSGMTPARALSELREFSSYLGDEIVIAAPFDGRGGIDAPVILAETRKEGLVDFAASHAGGNRDRLPLTVHDGLMVIAPGAGVALDGGFAQSAFRAAIGRSYEDGVGFLFAADLGGMVSRLGGRKPPAQLGIESARTFVVEQKEVAGRPELHAAVEFDGARTGIAGWLAEPVPMRVLDFISPDAAVASSIVLKNPGQLIHELFTMIESENSGFRARLAETEAELGFSIERDLAAAIGGEMAVAVDGPIFPVPSWKVVAEVYNAGQIQSAIQKTADAISRKSEGKVQVTITPVVVNGRTIYTIKAVAAENANAPKTVEGHYTFIDGYLLAAATPALLDQSIQSRAAGFTLTKSAAFIAMLPKDREPNASAVFYQNIGRSIKPLLDQLSAEQRTKLGALGDLPPVLVTAYGEAGRIAVATSGNVLSFVLNNMLAAQSPVALLKQMGTTPKGAAY